MPAFHKQEEIEETESDELSSPERPGVDRFKRNLPMVNFDEKQAFLSIKPEAILVYAVCPQPLGPQELTSV